MFEIITLKVFADHPDPINIIKNLKETFKSQDMTCVETITDLMNMYPSRLINK